MTSAVRGTAVPAVPLPAVPLPAVPVPAVPVPAVPVPAVPLPDQPLGPAPTPPAPRVFTAADAARLGHGRRELERLVERGHWRRLRHGAYCHGAVWDAADARLRTALLAAVVVRASSKRLVVSHLSAARLWDLPLPTGTRAPTDVRGLVLTVADPGEHPRRRGGVTTHVAPLPSGHAVRLDLIEDVDLLVTSPARTVADCLRQETLEDGVAMADAALRLGIATVDDLAVVARSQAGWQGVARLTKGLSLVDGRRETWLESASAVVMARCGLPVPESQVVVRDAEGRFVARADFGWPAWGVVGEADGTAKYGAADGPPSDEPDGGPHAARGGAPGPAPDWRQQLRREKAREDRLRDLGLEVVRWTAADLATPWQLRRRIEAAIARADPSRVTAVLSVTPRPGSGLAS